MKLAIRFLIAAVVCVSAAAQTPKNVIFLVGDGMGTAHFTILRVSGKGESRIGGMPVVGLVTTQSADDVVTDSGAAATAYATGFKTNNESLSVDATGTSHETVLEVAERAGKATGLVTTSYFWDATPAAFASHVKSRTQSLDIVNQMLHSGVEVIAGTGVERFGKQQWPAIDQLAKDAGFTLVREAAELNAASGPHVIAVFPSQPRDVDFPQAPLPQLARWALQRLQGDPDGFFLLIEEEGTDSSSHENNRPDLQASVASLDAAAGVALDFAAKRGDTLVVVTGDHETGALRISDTKKGRLRLEFSTIDHTGSAVPIFAYGPGSAAFAGFLDNTDVGKKLLSFVAAR